MFSAIRTSIITLCSMFTTLFGSANKGAQALDAMADVALEEAQYFRDTKRADRAKLVHVED